MFDIGFWELALVFVVALLVVGPQRLPGLVRSTAYWIGRMRQIAYDVKTEISMELDKAEQLKRLMDEQNDILKRTEQQYKETLSSDLVKDDKSAKIDNVEPVHAQPEKPLESEQKSAEEQPIMRSRSIPASMTPPKPTVHTVSESAEESENRDKVNPHRE